MRAAVLLPPFSGTIADVTRWRRGLASRLLYLAAFGLWASGFVVVGALVADHQNQLDAASVDFLRIAGTTGTVSIPKQGDYAIWVEINNSEEAWKAARLAPVGERIIGKSTMTGPKGKAVKLETTQARTYTRHTDDGEMLGLAVMTATLRAGDHRIVLPKQSATNVVVGPRWSAVPADAWKWLGLSGGGLLLTWLVQRPRRRHESRVAKEDNPIDNRVDWERDLEVRQRYLLNNPAPRRGPSEAELDYDRRCVKWRQALEVELRRKPPARAAPTPYFFGTLVAVGLLAWLGISIGGGDWLVSDLPTPGLLPVAGESAAMWAVKTAALVALLPGLLWVAALLLSRTRLTFVAWVLAGLATVGVPAIVLLALRTFSLYHPPGS